MELSPFVVSAETEETWLATSTLAGSRLNTPLRDTGASISVLTSEFLKDLGAIDLEDAAGYAVNIHVNTNEGTNTNDNWAMFNYDAQKMRIRGVPATVTRNYFRWNMQSDAYNADRIEENRGPNSILFGIGSAGGVINTLTKRANLSRDFRHGSISVGSYDSLRGTLDLNQRLVDGKLAVRVNTVYSEQGNYRHHAFNDTQRLHLASTWQARERTRFRLDYEIGEIESIGMRPQPAFDGISNWVAAGSPTVATVQTSNLGASGISRYANNQRRLTFVENLGSVYNYQGLNRAAGTGDVILDESIASFRVNPVGPYNRRDGTLQNLTVFWEERLADQTFLELSHNLQIANRETFVSGQGRTENATLYADPHQFLPDGTPNPYAGRLMFEGGRWNASTGRNKAHNTRLMLSHEMDFGKWGNYRLAAMGEYEWRREFNRNWIEVWDGAPFNSSPENVQNYVWRRFYVDSGQWASYHSGTGPIGTGLLRNVPDPTTPGRLLNSTWVPFNQGGQRDTYERQTTALLGGHARYFDGRLVLGVGFRKDELKVKTNQAQRHPVTNEWSVDHAGVEFEENEFSGTTRTLGAVAHPTRHISLFYNFSNSLDIPNTQHRILPDGRTPGTSEARGQDFGVGFTFFDGKLSARLNRYEVEMIGATGGGFGGTLDNPTVLNNRVLDALVTTGAISQQEADSRSFTTNQATIDRELEGYEFSLVGAVTKNWRVQVSYAYSNGYDSNIGPEVKSWAAETLPWYLQYANVVSNVEENGQLLTVGELVSQWEDNVHRLRWLREGDLILGNRKHKFSFFTRYGFDHGPLDGLYLGGGYRYQSAAPLGFDNDENLLWGDSQGEADAMIGYTFRGDRWFFKRGISVQLNVRNLFDDTDPRVTTFRGDGVRVQRAVIIPPRSWRLTVNFEF